MNNKYQEALNTLTDWFHSYKNEKGVTIHERHITPEYKKAKKVIQELVDKETPKKPNYAYDGYADGYPVYDIITCPNCDNNLDDLDVDMPRCRYCGQKLDWSEKDG